MMLVSLRTSIAIASALHFRLVLLYTAPAICNPYVISALSYSTDQPERNHGNAYSVSNLGRNMTLTCFFCRFR